MNEDLHALWTTFSKSALTGLLSNHLGAGLNNNLSDEQLQAIVEKAGVVAEMMIIERNKFIRSVTPELEALPSGAMKIKR